MSAHETTSMTATTRTRRFTYDDYCALPDDGVRREVIGGRYVVVPSPDSSHQNADLSLGVWLRTVVVPQRGGQVFIAPFDVILSPHDVVQPDALWIAPEHLDRLFAEGVFGAPTLAIELLSPSTRAKDLGKKKRLFAASGVPFYWIVDPHAHTIVALRLDGDRYVVAGEAAHDDVAFLPPFAELALPLAPLWPPTPPRRRRGRSPRRT